MTRLFYSMCIGVLSILVSLTLSAATLNVADALIVSSIDDKTVEHGFIGSKSTFTLQQGEHALIVRYKDVYEDLDFAEERVIESKAFVVTFSLVAEQQLTLDTVAITDLVQAERFAKNPKLKLIDENDKQVAFKLVDVAEYKLVQQVNIAVTSLKTNAATSNLVSPANTAQQQALSVQPAVNIKQTMAPENNISAQVNALTMLKFWWQKASEADKEQFKLFLQEK